MPRDIPDPIFIHLNSLPATLEPVVSEPADFRVSRVEEFLSARLLSENSKKAYRQDLQHFLNWTTASWNQVTPRQVVKFKEHLMRQDNQGNRVRSDASVKRILGTLKSFYGWLFRLRYVEIDPTIEVQLPKLPEPTAKNLSDEQVQAIFDAAAGTQQPERDLALFAVLLHGLRASSVTRLNIEDYDGQRLTIREDKADSKGSVPLSQEAQETLNFYLQWRRDEGDALRPESPLFVSNSNQNRGARITYGAIRKLCDRIQDRTGIHFHAHQLRHTFGTNFVLKGMNPYHVMTIMRIKSPATFKRYTKAAEQAAAEAEFRQFEK